MNLRSFYSFWRLAFLAIGAACFAGLPSATRPLQIILTIFAGCFTFLAGSVMSLLQKEV